MLNEINGRTEEHQAVSSDEHRANPGLKGVKVPLHKLVNCLDLPGAAKKQLKRIKKDQKVVDEALPAHEQKKIRRIIGFEGAVKQVNRWEPVIKENRKAKFIFPENTSGPSIKLNPPLAKITKPQTSLEKEVAQLLQANQEFLPEKKSLSTAEERALKAKSLQEAQERRALLQKEKALLSYYNAKMKRQSKIKSKSYRRIVRKTKEGNKAKQMELMQYKDPEAYKEWLQKEERKRIEERMTLKHRGSSRAMAKKIKYAKYDDQSRADVRNMLDKNRELTQKTSFFEEIDDDEDNVLPSFEVTTRKRTLEDMENMSDNDEDMERDEEVGKVGEEQEEDGNVVVKRAKIEKEAGDGNKKTKKTSKKEKNKSAKKKKNPVKEPKTKIDNASFMDVEKDLKFGSGQLRLVYEDEGGIDCEVRDEGTVDVKKRQKLLALKEVLSDPHVLADFEREKKDIIERDKPKDVDLVLPGWGEWTWAGLPVSRKKKRKFTFKAPEIPRKDRDLPNVIISETKDMAITKHQVSSLPHPYRNVAEFERKHKKPIGKQWNLESNYRNLIRPNIVTRIGHVINPISADAAR